MSLPREFHAAFAWVHMAGDQVEERGFAGAVRADDRVPFAFCQVKRDVPGRDEAAEILPEVLDA